MQEWIKAQLKALYSDGNRTNCTEKQSNYTRKQDMYNNCLINFVMTYNMTAFKHSLTSNYIFSSILVINISIMKIP